MEWRTKPTNAKTTPLHIRSRHKDNKTCITFADNRCDGGIKMQNKLWFFRNIYCEPIFFVLESRPFNELQCTVTNPHIRFENTNHTFAFRCISLHTTTNVSVLIPPSENVRHINSHYANECREMFYDHIPGIISLTSDSPRCDSADTLRVNDCSVM